MKKISERIYAYNRERHPEIVKFKYNYMTKNLFRFYRATCHIFYEDLSEHAEFSNSPVGWICGDLHLENFGSYKGNNGLVYFDINDFDEAVLAPVLWEAVRFVTSILVAFESLKINRKKARNMTSLFLKSYAGTLAKGKADYIERNTATGILKQFLNRAAKRKHSNILQKRTRDNKKIWLQHSNHLKVDKELKVELLQHFEKWFKTDENSPYNYQPVDLAFRLAGTSSLGINRYVILVSSTNNNGRKNMLLDMKQALPPALLPYVTARQPEFENDAERILFVQQLMQNRTAALLSSTIFNEKPYIIQEMQPTKDSINFKLIKRDYRKMCEVIYCMGMLMASSQLRASGRKGAANAEELVKFGMQTNWQDTVLSYATSYSEKMREYYANFKEEHKK